MRVVQVVGRYAPEHCGVAHYCGRLSDELRQRGVAMAIAAGAATAAAPVPMLTIPRFPDSIAGMIDLGRSARAWDADWVHLQFAPGTFDRRRIVTLLPLVLRACGAPRIAVTMHEYGGWPLRVGGRLQPLVDRLLRVAEANGWLDRESVTLLGQSDLAIVTNPDHVETIAARSARIAKRLEVVPIGPNVGPVVGGGISRAEARQTFNVSPSDLVVVFFGFVHPVKGVETLIRAARLAQSRGAHLTVWLVGGVHSLALRGAEADGYERSVRTLIDAESVSDVVTLTGYAPDREVTRRLAAADLAVLPFNGGTTLKSGSLITCLSHGLPTIATTGGSLEPLRHGHDVWLVPPRDPVALAEAIVVLGRDADTRDRLARNGLAASRQFSWSAIVDRHVELYERRGARSRRATSELSS